MKDNHALIYIGLIVLAGAYLCSKRNTKYTLEAFEGNKHKKAPRCPDVLVQKGQQILLYNTKLARIPGVNPVSFENLEEYVEFLKWQRSQGIDCPVLYLQKMYNSQGEPVYHVRPDPMNPSGGSPPMVDPSLLAQPETLNSGYSDPNEVQTLLTDAGRNDPPYNQNSFPAMDTQNQDIGLATPLTQYYNVGETQSTSANAMDSNWGGVSYARSAVAAGNYKDDEVSIMVQ
jgi:hypothetical protein